MKREWRTRSEELLRSLPRQKGTDHCDHGDRRSDERLPFQHRNSRNPDSGSYWYCCKIRIFKIQTLMPLVFAAAMGGTFH